MEMQIGPFEEKMITLLTYANHCLGRIYIFKEHIKISRNDTEINRKILQNMM